jgi:hypothetical protein
MALGAIMGGVAWVVERRLVKALHRRGETAEPRPRSGELELAATPEQVDQQPHR